MAKGIIRTALCAALFACPAIGLADSIPLPGASAPVSIVAAPRIPLSSEIPPPEVVFYSYPAAGLKLDTSDREAVRVFYKGLYSQSDNVPINWTGAYSSCTAGTTDQLYQDAVALRINWFRAMAGIPATVSLYGLYSQQDQQAALVMSVNGALNHTPPSTWTCWNQAAYDAAGKSNLSLGSIGPNAVTGYVRDFGSSNYPLGHRRWVLYPQTQNMGTGDVPAGTYNGANVVGANALWAIDSNYGKPRPTVRDDFVAWPPKGYVPYQVVFGRWSLSHSNADFTNATVTVSKGGANIPVSREALDNPAYGENTIVWLLQGLNDSSVWAKPASDDTYSVIVANVMLNGTPRTFSYNVTVFDPDTPTPNAPQTTVSAPQSASANSAFSANLTAIANATSYQVALYRLSSLAGAITPSTTPSPWTYVTGPANAYNPVEAASFHLYHSAFATQSLTLNKKLYIGQNASLSFVSWFTFALSGEIARAQVSLDDGNSWQDVYTEVGSSQTSQTTKTVNLAAYAGRFARLQFVFSYVPGTSAYFQSNTGWYFNNVNLTNVSEMLEGQMVSVPATQTSASFTASTLGSYVLAARTEYQGMYFTDWGPATALQLAAATTTTTTSTTSTTVGSTTTTTQGGGAVTVNLVSGWNLVGNGGSAAINVSAFSDASKFATVWKWIANSAKWAFYAPSLVGQQLTDYANSKGYDVLSTVNGGEGFWVNAKSAFSMQLPAGSAVSSASFQSMASGWNLIAIGDNKTPSAFNKAIGATPPPAGDIPLNLTTLWAWNAALTNWYFYAPSLEKSGGLLNYIQSKSYLDFGTKVLDPALGFWVNNP